MAREMSQLVGEHRLDLGSGETRNQSVEEHDALGRTKAGEICVAVAGASRAVHHEKTSRPKSASGEQGFDSAAQIRVLERREPVEESRDDRWVNRGDAQVECPPGNPNLEPPPF